MAYYSYSKRPVKKSAGKRRLLTLLLILVVGGLGFYLINRNNKAEAPQADLVQNSQEQATDTPAYVAPSLQPVIDKWANAQAADYSISIYDLQAKQIVAQNNPDEVIFAASLYKMYVAYFALLDTQNGDMDPNEVLTGGFTRKQCIDKMIRESHSPCGEAMMADIGQTTLNQRVKDLGMTGTFFNGIRTSATDSAKILQYIAEKRDLNEENTTFLIDAMTFQDAKWRRGLATGAPQATWASKVGWNEDENYHDIGIMTLPDSSKFVVAILGQGSGSSIPIADFARIIYDSLTE